MPNAHIAYRVDYETLLKHPEQVLQKMSFKILEKRNAIFESLKDKKVRFKSVKGIQQGICQSMDGSHCVVQIADTTTKVPLEKLILSDQI